MTPLAELLFSIDDNHLAEASATTHYGTRNYLPAARTKRWVPLDKVPLPLASRAMPGRLLGVTRLANVAIPEWGEPRFPASDADDLTARVFILLALSLTHISLPVPSAPLDRLCLMGKYSEGSGYILSFPTSLLSGP